MRTLAISLFLTLMSCNLSSWEDGPSVQEHKETDRMFKAAEKLTGAAEYQARMMQEQEKKSLKDFKKSKFKRKENAKKSK